jgi:hypothetical protein
VSRIRFQPDDYLPEIHAWIESGKTLRSYCRQDGKPSYGTVYDWLEADAHTPEKTEISRFAHARDLGEQQILQECLEIADDTQPGEIVTERPVFFEGNPVFGPDGKQLIAIERKRADMLEHRKLRIETRLKLLAKWNPKKYGDKVQAELTGADGGPMKSEITVQFVKTGESQ